jgi:hypothetical protein
MDATQTVSALPKRQFFEKRGRRGDCTKGRLLRAIALSARVVVRAGVAKDQV